MNGRARSLRIGMLTATVTAAFLAACGGDDDIVDTSHLDGSAGVAGSLGKDGSTDTGKAGTGGSSGAAGSSGTAASSGIAGSAGSGGAAGVGGSSGAAGAEAGPSGAGGVNLDGSTDGTTDAGTAGNSGLDASDSSATTGDANDASDALGAIDASGAIDAGDASNADETMVSDAALIDAATADTTTGDGAVGDAPGPYCGDGITNGAEQCDHGSRNSNAFYSGCTTGCQQTSLIAWLDGADPNGDGSSITGGTSMSKWVDKARNNDALQGTITQQPSYVVAGINGVPGLLFDGSNDSLALPVDINYGALPNITVIAVFKNAPGSPAPYAGVWGQDNGGWDRFLVSGGNGQTGISNGTGFTAVTGLTADGVALISVTTLRSGAASSVHVDGSLAASFTESHDNSGTTSVSVGDLNGPTAAPFGAFDGVISEIMIFDRALTSQERNTLGAMLATKYGVTQYCGDGVKQGTEACDDGTNDGSMGCDADCTLSPSASILLHCDATSQILQTFVGAGCHELVVTGGASYITFLTATTQAIIYPTTDCSGTVSLPVTADLNFCGVNFNDGSGVNDRVWSAYLSK